MKIRNFLPVVPVAAGVIGALSLTSGCRPQAGSEDAPSMAYEVQLKAEEKARSGDPAWNASTVEVAVIRAGDKSNKGTVQSFCLNTNGSLLACCTTRTAGGEARSGCIKAFSPEGKLLSTWQLPAGPEAICVDRDGAIFAGGSGRLFRLDQEGKVLASAESPLSSQRVALDKTALETLFGRKPTDGEVASYQQTLQQRKGAITGIAASGQDVFVACPSVSDFTYAVYRLDRDLKNPVLVVKGLHGCCGQMDVQAKDGKLWIPHNARHRVECYERDGRKIVSFGKADRKAADGFGGCCEPKNVRFGSDGNLYAAESGPPVAIKRFTADGKFGGVVALPAFSSGCVRVTVDVSPDCRRFYILDTGGDSIHVFAPKT